MAFERRFTDTAIKNLKEEELFKEHLLNDIRHNDVFPAVRRDRMDFYHKGGKLFSYDVKNRFRTHLKYASVVNSDSNEQYVTETDLKAIASFSDGYHRIKENCSKYSGVEAKGVSWIYENFSCTRLSRPDSVVVLDIEISLRRDEEEEADPGAVSRSGSDRIDLLLLDTKSGALRFFEAKHFSNNDIRAKAGHKPPRIISQIERYKTQLKKTNVHEEILESYAAHVKVINELFGPKVYLHAPQVIDPVPRLLIFGFDEAQRRGKLKGEMEILEGKPKPDLSVYAIGSIKQVKLGTMFSGGIKRWALTMPES